MSIFIGTNVTPSPITAGTTSGWNQGLAWAGSAHESLNLKAPGTLIADPGLFNFATRVLSEMTLRHYPQLRWMHTGEPVYEGEVGASTERKYLRIGDQELFGSAPLRVLSMYELASRLMLRPFEGEHLDAQIIAIKPLVRSVRLFDLRDPNLSPKLAITNGTKTARANDNWLTSFSDCAQALLANRIGTPEARRDPVIARYIKIGLLLSATRVAVENSMLYRN